MSRTHKIPEDQDKQCVRSVFNLDSFIRNAKKFGFIFIRNTQNHYFESQSFFFKFQQLFDKCIASEKNILDLLSTYTYIMLIIHIRQIFQDDNLIRCMFVRKKITRKGMRVNANVVVIKQHRAMFTSSYYRQTSADYTT